MAATSTPRTRRPRAEREQIVLDTAADLFYARGVHEVGMDELVTATGLGKATVYRLYPTKTDLIAAYLQRSSDRILATIDTIADDYRRTARERLRQVLDDIWVHVTSPGFRGCAFNNASIEFDDPDHPARQVATNHRVGLLDRLRRIAGDTSDPSLLASQLACLIDGVYTNAAHLGPDGPAVAGYRLAHDLIDTATR